MTSYNLDMWLDLFGPLFFHLSNEDNNIDHQTLLLKYTSFHGCPPLDKCKVLPNNLMIMISLECMAQDSHTGISHLCKFFWYLHQLNSLERASGLICFILFQKHNIIIKHLLNFQINHHLALSISYSFHDEA